MSLTNIV